MKLVLILFAVVSVATACTTKRRQEEFESFRRTYRKVYKDEIEYNYRCAVFNDNMDIIEGHNFRHARSLETYTLRLNEFTDLTREEFISMYTGLKPELEQRTRADMTSRSVYEYNPNFKAPTSVNWTADGYDTPIKNQGKCGSCYTFATAGTLESRFLIKNKKPFQWEDVSEQHFLECSTAYNNNKCMGGLMTNTYRYMLGEKHGTQNEDNYPYISADGNNGTNCHYQSGQSPFGITGFVEVDKNDAALEQAVALGPVAVGVNADTWQNIGDGVFCPKGGILGSSSGCGTTFNLLGLNHAVIVVGYTPEFWIIKNSWGVGWGEAGYMRLCRKYSNNCGITMLASYPLL